VNPSIHRTNLDGHLPPAICRFSASHRRLEPPPVYPPPPIILARSICNSSHIFSSSISTFNFHCSPLHPLLIPSLHPPGIPRRSRHRTSEDPFAPFLLSALFRSN
jgi:hypothetical protein